MQALYYRKSLDPECEDSGADHSLLPGHRVAQSTTSAHHQVDRHSFRVAGVRDSGHGRCLQ